jgi:hypothetical protein
MAQNKNVILGFIAIGMLVAAGVILGLTLGLRKAQLAEENVTPTRTPGPTQSPFTDTPELPTITNTSEPSPTPTLTATQQAAVAESGGVSVPVNTQPPADTATPTTEPLGEVEGIIGEPEYLAGGRWAEVMVTLRNISVESGIQTGYEYTTRNPGGGTQYVTAFGVYHDIVPQPLLDADAPLWRATVLFSDGNTYLFPAGCFYVETIEAEGWEPVGPAEGFSWHVFWTGGFFDCGNSTHKIPTFRSFFPGQEVTIPLYVYLQHPRVWEDPAFGPPGIRIRQIDVEAFNDQGVSLGTVASAEYP